MFFAPSIALLRRRKADIHLLCLSTGARESKVRLPRLNSLFVVGHKGDFDGLGEVRRVELLSACQAMGIPRAHCDIINSQTLRDGMQEVWGEEEVAELTSKAVERWNIQQVVTFDDYGISGHRNHISCYQGVSLLFQSDDAPAGVTGWELQSLPWYRKYLGPIEAAIATVVLRRPEAKRCQPRTTVTLLQATPRSPLRACSLWQVYGGVHPATLIAVDAEGYTVANAGMEAHSTQNVWFRRLFTIFSQAIYINTYQAIGFAGGAARGA